MVGEWDKCEIDYLSLKLLLETRHPFEMNSYSAPEQTPYGGNIGPQSVQTGNCVDKPRLRQTRV